MRVPAGGERFDYGTGSVAERGRPIAAVSEAFRRSAAADARNRIGHDGLRPIANRLQDRQECRWSARPTVGGNRASRT